MFNIFSSVLYDKAALKEANVYPSVQNNQIVYQIANAPTINQGNKWKNADNIKGQLLGIILLPFPGQGAIVLLETGDDNNQTVYQITVDMYSLCTCSDFTNMAILAIRGQQQYVNCNH